jgi:3-hydroxybutyrate dehydrogenase
MLHGKAALVTGSTSGIGLGIARTLAAAGADIALNGFGDAAEIETLRAGIAAEHKVKAIYIAADVSKPQETTALVERTEREFGRLDILVNNAGIQHVAKVQDFPPEKWEQIIAINLSAAFYATRAALPGMLARNWGRVINIASVHGLVASVEKSAYIAAKHGLVGFTKAVALETAKTGITCNAICPGFVLTPLVQKQIDDRAQSAGLTIEQAKHALLGEKTPSLELVTFAELGGVAVFLCSDAAAQIRGTALPIDGGWTAQ